METKRKHRSLFLPLWMEESDSSDAMTSSDGIVPSSPSTSSEGDRRMFFHSIRHKARRSLSSRESLPASAFDTAGDASPGKTSGGKLSKSRRQSSTSTLDALHRRASGFSEDSRISRTSTTLSTSSSTAVDWRSQKVEGFTSLEPDTLLLRNKTPYMVVTTEYILKLKSHADVLAMFPQLAPEGKADTSASIPEPLLAIPLSSVVSVFMGESTRPSFGMEVWWRPTMSLAFQHTSFFFNLPTDRKMQLQHVLRALGSVSRKLVNFHRFPSEILQPLKKIQAIEEPDYKHQDLEIFPVVLRGRTRKEGGEDSQKKIALETPSSYLVVGANMCYLVEAHRAPGKRGEVLCKHKAFGLITLDCLKADWAPHEERFNIAFRDPFKPSVTLELASRFYRDIVQVLAKADAYLKPTWPDLWRENRTFQIMGIKDLYEPVQKDDYGSVKRTLDAYITAYRCGPVEWEINWKTQFAPEFRLRPAKNGSPYSPLQLLAVLRALRYNDYFSSLSFQDIDLSILWNYYDISAKGPDSAYINRTGVLLSPDEIDLLRMSPLLHQEFHALAFCSGTIRQIDFTNAFRALPTKCKIHSRLSVQFITPILNLLKASISKCSRLILSGCVLTPMDLDELAETLKCGAIQGLDISRCSLTDMDLRGVLDAAVAAPQALQVLDVSNNTGRFPAAIVPRLVEGLAQIKELKLCGSLREELDGPLIYFETLDCLYALEELDLSKFKLNEETLLDLEKFLFHRSLRLDRGEASNFRRLLLNNCGITGAQAARLFRAIGVDHGIHLFLNGNPLDEGLEYLAEAIRYSQGPAALSMEMVEFKSERRYAEFIRALAATEHLSFLNLVGTSPILQGTGVCSKDTLSALEEFFAHNKSIRYLDISGFSGKLDEGQLGKGFGHSLMGLTKNTTMTHLRVRNQNLHDDAGTLGVVISENKFLRMLDCQDNKLNMTSLQFLVSSLKSNFNIVEFPFSPEERGRIWAEILVGLRRQTSSIPSKKEKTPLPLQSQETMLREVFWHKFEELGQYLVRNRELLENTIGQAFEYESPSESGDEGNWPRLGLMAGASVTIPEEDDTPTGINEAAGARRPATIRSSNITIDTSIPAPYHIPAGDGAESPTDTLGHASEMSTTPELVSPSTPDDVAFLKLIDGIKAHGLI